MNKHYRQGDVLLVKVDCVPNDAEAEKIADKQIVLAHGEVTGHSHRISAEHASAYQWEGDRLIKVQEPTDLVHEEHSSINLDPGVYKVVIQREYTPSAIRKVVD